MVDIMLRARLTPDGDAELDEMKRSAPVSLAQFNQLVEQARIGIQHDQQAREREE